ncbi:hypothetical protein AHAS_Ahas04G0144300 [Arachis hypogaea]
MLVFIISGSCCHSNSREAGKRWFQGTADAMRQFHWLFENHRESGADITLSCLPMDDSRASDFGLLKIDDKGIILSFSEKPKGEDLKAMQVDTTVLRLSKEEAVKKPYIVSMGVYIFKKEILLNLLRY